MKNSYTKLLVLYLLLIIKTADSFGQTPITAANTTYIASSSGETYVAPGAVSSPLVGNTYTYTYGNLSGTTNNNNKLNNFTAGGIIYNFLSVPGQYVKMRRANNAVVQGIRNLKWDEGTTTGTTLVNVVGTYNDNMESFFNGNANFNTGTDNVFGNQGDGNGDNNDIERLDVIFPNGTIASDNTKVGFSVFERGATNQHDPVKVALILSIDSTGMPTSYSTIIGITPASYGTTDVVAGTNYVISRRDNAVDSFLKVATTTNQAIGGVFFKYSDFGIANFTPVYGYSLIPNDFTGTPAQALNYSDSTLFPHNTSSITDSSGGIDPVGVSGISQSSPVIEFPISGNVFDDANGLTDNTVNGTGTNINGKLYVHLISSTNTVIATTAVSANGTYQFSNITPGTYSIVLDTSSDSISTATLPTGWVNTGENLGSGPGNDGLVNGILTSVVVDTNNVINADFGIEQLPVSNNQTYNISAPPLNSSITLDGTSGGVPGPLSGSDPEDGVMGSGKTVIITVIPTNSLLYYNGNVVTDSTVINNYNPSLLQVKFTTTGSLNTSFQYSFVDAAGNQSTAPATYLLSWASTLPVVLTNFTVENQNDDAVLNWETSSELNVKVFNIERSTDDGKTWNPIGEVAATGNSSVTQLYSFTDANPENGTNLYRLQIEDDNGSLTYSSINEIEIAGESSMKIYPNPVGQEEALNIELAGLKTGPYEISLVSSAGQVVKDMVFTISSSGSAALVIPTGNIARGSYIVIVKGNNLQFSKTVIVTNR